MPYLHEQRLAEARKRLYMLGQQNPRKPHNLAADMKAGAGFIAPLMDNKSAQEKLVQEQAKKKLAEQAQERDDIEFIKGNKSASPVKNPYYYDPMNPTIGGQDKMYIKYGNTGFPMADYDPNEGLAEIDKHNAAMNASIGGQDHLPAIEQRAQQAVPMGQDLEYSRNLIKQGGMMNSLSQLKPGTY